MTTNQNYWSPSVGGFFSDDIHGARQIPVQQTDKEIEKGKRPKLIDNPDTLIPADAVAITEAKYHELFDAQANGQQIADHRGRPRAVDRVDTVAERAARNRRRRDRLLRDSDWTQLGDALLDQLEIKAAWSSYRQLLRDIDLTADLADEDWPAVPAAEPAEDE